MQGPWCRAWLACVCRVFPIPACHTQQTVEPEHRDSRRDSRPASPLTLTVNRPLVLLRLPMKNRAPCMDRVAGKGTSAVLKTMGEGFRATKEQLAEAIYQKR